MNFREIIKEVLAVLNYPLPILDKLTIGKLLFLLFALLLLSWIARFTKRLLIRRVFADQQEIGRQFAVVQITQYFIYVIGVAIALNSVGYKLNAFFLASSALLVGVGIGLQQTFNDLVCGLILLFEGSVKVGDIIELDSVMGRVTSIGIRTSAVETREGIVIIVPNSKFIVDNVINWSRSQKATRFLIKVGVAYGSDVRLVEQKLIEAAREQSYVVETPEPPFVVFRNFGDNSLEFELMFWTHNMWEIEIIESDIRFSIDALFRANDITIAFPQRDIHIKIEEKEVHKLAYLKTNS